MLIDVYLDSELYGPYEREFYSGLVLPKVLEKYASQLKHARQRMMISTADLKVADLLKVPVNSAVGEVLYALLGKTGEAPYRRESR